MAKKMWCCRHTGRGVTIVLSLRPVVQGLVADVVLHRAEVLVQGVCGLEQSGVFLPFLEGGCLHGWFGFGLSRCLCATVRHQVNIWDY